MREHAPVYWDEAGQVWGIASYADVMTVSKDPPTFCSSQGMRPDTPSMPYMVNLDDPLHRQRRALVNKGFTVRRVAEREPRLREICVDLIERAKARGCFDFVRDLAAWLPLIVIGDMLGVQPDAYADLLRWSDDMLSSSGVMIPERLDRAQQAFLEYREYQMRVIADRRARPPQDDLVSVLVHAEIDGAKLDDDALVMESLLILIGGDETTRHVISGGMYQLFHHPEQRRTLAQVPTKIPTAVEEMLRWVSPIQNMARTATRDVMLHGQRIRQGDKLLLLYPSANRDAAVFGLPLTFNVARTPNDHVAFGFGAHYCLGASLARLELRVLFEELLARMPTLELTTDAPPPMRESNFITGIESLPVEWRG
ncbi:MAG: cytochrome P450 [Deltaproteobacteria bacterium]|nr:cytochrome P450 [Deltaproteobacteria bacterium]MBI3389431.1 cytochrome P450 [Deltaproteobacteria bacterium]